MIYFIVLALVAILAVVAYNMYQESQYRKQVREQFGHSDKDALLGSKTDNVRDGRQASGGKGLMSRKAAKPQQNAAMRNLQEQDALFAARVAQAAATKPGVANRQSRRAAPEAKRRPVGSQALRQFFR